LRVESARGTPVVIGWAEYVDIAEWGITHMRAKVDTGARSSALHVENIEELSSGRVRFDVRLHRKHLDRRVTVEAPILRRGRVKPSSGHSQSRIFVKARVRIGPLERDIELSLVDRENMIFRMLLGRSALASDFLVDVGRRYLISARERRKRKLSGKRRLKVGR
jgi:hypothetical protein